MMSNVQQTSGSRVYPVAYLYDSQGRMTNMATWMDFPEDWQEEDTSWNYDPQRGWLTAKNYAPTLATSYTYTPAGRLKSRRWSRANGISTTYSHNGAGDVSTVVYSDGTPGVTNTYDRLGRPINIVRNGVSTTLAYDWANDPLGESYVGGVLDGLRVTNFYDGLLRRVGNSALTNNTVLATATDTYDAAGRLAAVSDGNNNAATYSYLTNRIFEVFCG
jgi:YD repeat-containing protein